MLGDHADEVFHHFQGLALAELMLLRQLIGQDLDGDRLWAVGFAAAVTSSMGVCSLCELCAIAGHDWIIAQRANPRKQATDHPHRFCYPARYPCAR